MNVTDQLTFYEENTTLRGLSVRIFQRLINNAYKTSLGLQQLIFQQQHFYKVKRQQMRNLSTFNTHYSMMIRSA
jgi:hypothetical protein